MEDKTIFTYGILALIVLTTLQMAYISNKLGNVQTAIEALGTKIGTAAAAPTPTQQQPPAAKIINMAGLEDDDAVKGSKTAKVTIIEWSDYECPFCARFYKETYGQIDTDYIKTGKVKLIFRDYPLTFHTQAQKAAEAAECAGEQGKYYDMHNMLFEKGVVGGVTTFKQYAKDLGLDTAKFDKCLDDGAMAAEVAKDMADGTKNGITGTPAFAINGKLVVGAQPYAVFKEAIESALKN